MVLFSHRGAWGRVHCGAVCLTSAHRISCELEALLHLFFLVSWYMSRDFCHTRRWRRVSSPVSSHVRTAHARPCSIAALQRCTRCPEKKKEIAKPLAPAALTLLGIHLPGYISHHDGCHHLGSIGTHGADDWRGETKVSGNSLVRDLHSTMQSSPTLLSATIV